MLINVNFVSYKTKINVKIKPKTKNHVCPNSKYFSCIRENRARKLMKKQVLVIGRYQKWVPQGNEIRVNQ